MALNGSARSRRRFVVIWDRATARFRADKAEDSLEAAIWSARRFKTME